VSPKKYRTGFFPSLAALLLALCYLLSVNGIDVHFDLEHGRTYVVSGFLASDCESIHPHSHCADAEGDCLEDEACCSDDLRTVLSQSDDSDGQPEIPAPAFRSVAVCHPVAAPAVSRPVRVARFQRPPPDPVGACSRFCVLRV
jgi:hypothetical protein